MMSYNNLPFVPSVIAETVCHTKHFGQKMNESKSDIDDLELKRKSMSDKDVDEFCFLTDEKCREAFNAKAKWFMKCVKAKGNRGRNQLYVWIRHWLVSYLKNRIDFIRSSNLENINNE